MEGSREVIAAIVAGVGRPAKLVRAEGEVRRHNAEAAQLREQISALLGGPDNGTREQRLGELRRAHIQALDAASRAQATVLPLLSAYRQEIAAALAPVADRLVAEIAGKLDAFAAELQPAIEAHNQVAAAIGRNGGVKFFLPSPALLPDGFAELVSRLTRYAESRARQAAGDGKMRLFLRRL